MTWRDRIIVDGNDRDAWEAARSFRIGASDVKAYAKPESVDKYVAAKIRPKSFFGNETTRSGHRWEPMILAYLGVPGNTAFVHTPGNDLFACTVDGISETDPFTIAEAKTRHNVIKPDPDMGEWRQLAWQFYCFPEAVRLLFGTLTLVRDDNGEWVERKDGYSKLEIPRDHPKIVAAIAQVLPIAEQVIAALDAAQQALKEVQF